MTPKEKAKELKSSMYKRIGSGSIEAANFYAKQCALICVDEIIKIVSSGYDINMIPELDYWQEVKREINKL